MDPTEITLTIHTLVNYWTGPMSRKNKEFLDKMVVAAFWRESISNSDMKKLKGLYLWAISGHKTVPLMEVKTNDTRTEEMD